MTLPFLLFANAVLLLRLPLLLGDAPSGWRVWLAKAVAELLVLATFRPTGAVCGLAVVVVAANVLHAWWDQRRAERSAGHLLVGALELVAASVALSGAAGAALRSGWSTAVENLREWSTLGPLLAGLFEPGPLVVLLALLLAANEANLIIRWGLGRLQLRPGAAAPARLDPREYNRGRVIGLIERVLIFTFVFGGHFGAVGFTLAAKGFTRFRELEDRSFAEYVLIGTLLSSGLAMLAALLARGAI